MTPRSQVRRALTGAVARGATLFGVGARRGVLARSVALAGLAGLAGPALWILIDLARLIPEELVGLLLSLLAVMVSAASAVLAAVSALLAQSARSAQLGGLAFGLAGYSLVMLSLTSGISTTEHHPAAEALVLAGWMVPAGGRLGVGLRRRGRDLGWVGGGVAVLGFAHVQNGIWPGPDPDLVFGALRLLGLLLVAVGVVLLAHRNQRAVQQSRVSSRAGSRPPSRRASASPTGRPAATTRSVPGSRV